ncbi:MAG: hypothetical protein NT123_12815, partial [Proteobacteria bacterium]|nr:hypothetical protein [Pseudomonadota bacterium]
MRRFPRSNLPARQRGLAMLVLLALFATAAAYMLVNALNKGSVAMNLARADKKRAVMQEAKAALIAWAASEALQTQSGATFQAGALPCPDLNNDGTIANESTCGAANRLGRLPYKTLGIGELRDASGELLWYGLSGNFRRRTTAAINSDTQGQLSISGLTPASNIVAVVLAPGMRLGTQDRTPAGTACNASGQACNIAANYLEGINGDTTTTNYVTAVENLTDPVVANLFNDQLLAITQQDLMSMVEPVVAGRIKRDIVLQYIYNSDSTLTDSGKVWSDNPSNRNKSRYFDAWGAFPFAAPFATPSSSTLSPNFTGQATPTPVYEGLLPVVSNLSYNWNLGSGSIGTTGGTGTVTSTSCSTTTSANLICSITYSGSTLLSISMSGTVNNVGRSFVQLTQLSDVTSSGGSLSARTLSGSLDSAGVGTVKLDATLPDSAGSNTVTITIKNVSLVTSPLLSITSTDIAGWFTPNNWDMNLYYAVSPGYAPGGGASCNLTSPKCLSVYNLPSPYANPTTDTRAIIVLAGRSLSTNPSRPNGTLSDYLEG